MTQFEDCVMSESLPVNSIAAANRLIELLRLNGTNSILSARKDWRVRAIVWFLMEQLTENQIGTVDMDSLYTEAYNWKGDTSVLGFSADTERLVGALCIRVKPCFGEMCAAYQD